MTCLNHGAACSQPEFSEQGPISPCVCSRVLLYVQGLDIDAVSGVALALESLRRTGEALPALIKAETQKGTDEIALAEAMRILRGLLDEKGIKLGVTRNGQALQSAPPLNRTTMLAEEMNLSPLRSGIARLCQKLRGGRGATASADVSEKTRENAEVEWAKVGLRRRLLLLFLILVPSFFASSVMHTLLPTGGYPLLRVIITALFTVLFIWISVGFWSAVSGLIMLLRRYNRFSLTGNLPETGALPEHERTALLFPIYNEDALSVTAGVRTVLQSLRELGREKHFDIFILSDSTKPDAWIREEEAWHALCAEENAFGQVFYRRRRKNRKRKSGNIADFCRRWGANYKYMVVFDADSLMSGDSLTRMVRIMEANPGVGILQTPPKIIKSRSLIARIQQFSNHLYGPIFAAGLHYWQLGDAQYWGHNAIIRVEPFMRHCQLPVLPGRAPLGGEILSHDFVEAALMRRAGYGVWLAYDLPGSYEQGPPSLIDELIRDRRWCQGNLQHSRLVFAGGFFPTHRALFINGIMSYFSALLWFLFLVASSAQAMAELFVVPAYFPSGYSLFPDWPQYFPNWALTMFSGTLTLLFLPKIFAALLVLLKGGAKAFGGGWAMAASLLAEVMVSTFLAPVRMLFHSLFVMSALLGRNSGWNTQNRDDSGTSWADAARFHWKGTALGLAWGGLIYFVNPAFFIWMSPIMLGLALSIPLSVWTSRVSLGERACKIGLFRTPADTEPADELAQLEKNLRKPLRGKNLTQSDNDGFTRAVTMPGVFALHYSLAGQRRKGILKNDLLQKLLEKALAQGPDALSQAEKMAVLSAPEALMRLHRAVWELNAEKAALWGIN